MSLTEQDKSDLKAAIRAGNLRVRSACTKTGEVRLSQVSDVMRHETPHKEIVKVTDSDGRSVSCTADHSLFRYNANGSLTEVPAKDLTPGSRTVILDSLFGKASPSVVVSNDTTLTRPFTYDLSVPGDQNFFLANGILAHNSYSIGGVSLDLEKSSKYEGIKNNAESQLDKMLEAKTRTVKIIRGLQQSRYGLGVRSSFGPITGNGILTPAKFLGLNG